LGVVCKQDILLNETSTHVFMVLVFSLFSSILSTELDKLGVLRAMTKTKKITSFNTFLFSKLISDL
jgi:hypothetical protein